MGMRLFIVYASVAASAFLYFCTQHFCNCGTQSIFCVYCTQYLYICDSFVFVLFSFCVFVAFSARRRRLTMGDQIHSHCWPTKMQSDIVHHCGEDDIDHNNDNSEILNIDHLGPNKNHLWALCSRSQGWQCNDEYCMIAIQCYLDFNLILIIICCMIYQSEND